MDPLPSIILLVVLVALSAFFSASETSFSSLNKIRFKTMAQEGNKRTKFAYKMSENFDKLLFTILIGNNIVNIAATATFTLLFLDIITSSESLATTVSTVAATVVLLVFGEITPKTIAKMHPESFAVGACYILYFFVIILTPLSFVFGAWKSLIVKLFKLKSDEGITEEELINMVEEASNEGSLNDSETNLIRSAIEFNDLDVGNILVPRVNVIAIDKQMPMDEIKGLFLEHTFSRLPVYDGSIDNIVGMLLEKDFYDGLNNGATTIDGYIKEIAFATEHMKISVLLKSLQKQKIHMAVVVDEYGGTLGIVTMEDILEELVGEIYDEHDEVVEYFTKLGDNLYKVDGNAELDDFFELFGLEYDEDDFDANTVGGWVVEELGNLPRENDVLDYENLHITITKVNMTRVLELSVEVKPEAVETDDDEDEAVVAKHS